MTRRATPALTVAALGVVFGDIGTSPLYTLKTCFDTSAAAPTAENVLGICSLLFWALVWVVCVKYVGVLMRADHEGEGGILALLALVAPPRLLKVARAAGLLVWVVVIGAAMLIGDAIITPAISVISAVEGLGVATTAATPWIVPISAGLLLALFAIQYRGTQMVGSLFGPVMLVWFAAIGIVGAMAIVHHPEVLWAVDPRHALAFLVHGAGWKTFIVFGAVVLAVTGAEALYADMSHFGRGPIAVAWYGLVLPALTLSYFGQGAQILSDPKALASPFYALTGGWMLLPMVGLAAAATIIASQAVISGVFTLTEQAIALNLSPRMKVFHTSSTHSGQVYVPFMNVALAVACLALVFAFRSSDRLASAYGLAVAGTMLATDIVFYVVATRKLHWNKTFCKLLVGAFALVDGLFFVAGLPKFLDGAWIPIAISVLVTTLAITWLAGRRALAESLTEQQEPVTEFLERHPVIKGPVAGTVVFLTGDPNGVPFVSNHRWLNAILDRERIVLLTLKPASRPYVESDKRVVITDRDARITKIAASFGYMERPSIVPVIAACDAAFFELDSDRTLFVYADPVVVPKEEGGLPAWQRRLFEILQRISISLPDEMKIKANRRVAVGLEVDV